MSTARLVAGVLLLWPAVSDLGDSAAAQGPIRISAVGTPDYLEEITKPLTTASQP